LDEGWSSFFLDCSFATALAHPAAVGTLNFRLRLTSLKLLMMRLTFNVFVASVLFGTFAVFKILH
jgi:hypothetical protein